MKKDKSAFLEIKNKHNTMNGASKESAINKLKEVKLKYPNAICAIGIINGKNHKKLICESPEVYEYSGEELFNLIFSDKNYYQTVKKIIQEGLKGWFDKYKERLEQMMREERLEQTKRETDIKNITITGTLYLPNGVMMVQES